MPVNVPVVLLGDYASIPIYATTLLNVKVESFVKMKDHFSNADVKIIRKTYVTMYIKCVYHRILARMEGHAYQTSLSQDLNVPVFLDMMGNFAKALSSKLQIK